MFEILILKPESQCPSCAQTLAMGTPLAACATCRMPHHMTCWRSAGKCGVPGCGGARRLTLPLIHPPTTTPAQARLGRAFLGFFALAVFVFPTVGAILGSTASPRESVRLWDPAPKLPAMRTSASVRGGSMSIESPDWIAKLPERPVLAAVAGEGSNRDPIVVLTRGDSSGHLCGLRRSNGALVWSRPFPRARREQSLAVAVFPGCVAVLSRNGELEILDAASGSTKRVERLEAADQSVRVLGTAPGGVSLGGDSKVVDLRPARAFGADPVGADVKMNTLVPKTGRRVLAAAGGLALYSGQQEVLELVSLPSGKSVWKTRLGGIARAAVIGSRRIFVSGERLLVLCRYCGPGCGEALQLPGGLAGLWVEGGLLRALTTSGRLCYLDAESLESLGEESGVSLSAATATVQALEKDGRLLIRRLGEQAATVELASVRAAEQLSSQGDRLLAAWREAGVDSLACVKP
ncbi:MAG: hypothetical protein HY816_21185 [Candidatus Wallbacteria bacterium]|nr:hypothetical protein [Candidatus Wallbacteria bacterium]